MSHLLLELFLTQLWLLFLWIWLRKFIFLLFNRFIWLFFLLLSLYCFNLLDFIFIFFLLLCLRKKFLYFWPLSGFHQFDKIEDWSIFIVIIEQSLLFPFWRIAKNRTEIFLDDFNEVVHLVRYNLLINPFYFFIVCAYNEDEVIRVMKLNETIVKLSWMRLFRSNYHNHQIMFVLLLIFILDIVEGRPMSVSQFNISSVVFSI